MIWGIVVDGKKNKSKESIERESELTPFVQPKVPNTHTKIDSNGDTEMTEVQSVQQSAPNVAPGVLIVVGGMVSIYLTHLYKLF